MSTSSPAVPALDVAVARALDGVDLLLSRFGEQYPDDTTRDGFYPLRARPGQPDGANLGWTTGFWPGMLWLAAELTAPTEPERSAHYRDAALRHVPGFAARIRDRVDVETHDLGFLYTLSCSVAWRVTGDAAAHEAALAAADHLMGRALEPAGIIQAWGDLSDPAQRGRTIIDSLMNMPLLHWAAERTGEGRYRDTAHRHVTQLSEHILRADDSTFHTFYWDPATGEPLRGATQQGHSDDSAWARGQAWGIYGFALNARHTGDLTFRDAAVRCADHFLAHLPADRVAYWDLVFGDGSGQPRDSSSAAIAACGLDELARLLPPGEPADRYRAEAAAIVTSLASGYVPEPGTSDALLAHAVYDLPTATGVDEGCLWGDYYYLEALLRLTRPHWRPFW